MSIDINKNEHDQKQESGQAPIKNAEGNSAYSVKATDKNMPQNSMSDAHFTNRQVNSEEITTSTLNMQALSPKFRQINLYVSAFWGGLVLSILAILASNWLFAIPQEAHKFLLAAFALVGFLTIWSLAYHWFADPLKKYALREHDVNFQTGLLFRRLVSQPILRIQHIELKRGPIERKAGLATLQVFSAGGVSHTFYIPGLEYERAVQLRQFILDHKDLASDV